jgi:myo-inositol-1(or 4)-monophosphatase
VSQGFLEFALSTARAAGEELMDRFEGALHISSKSAAGDLVTDADRAAEAVILARIKAAYPDHGVLAEESGVVGPPAALRWIVDPLDGTTNFAHRLPHFSVSIALVDADGPLVGVVHDPNRDETFFATRGGGAFLDSARARARAGQPARLAVTAVTTLREALVATGFPYVRDRDNLPEVNRVIPQIRCLRRCGSAALDLSYVAAGRLDGYWEASLAPWDIAAGALLVREAGGVVQRMNGEPWRLPHGDLTAGGPSLVRLLTDELIAARTTA